MTSPGAAEFCTVLVTVIFTTNGGHGENLQRFCLQQAILTQAFAHQDEANGKFRHE